MGQSAAVPIGAQPGRNPFAGSAYRWWWAMTLCMSLAVGVQIVTVPTFVQDRTDVRFYVALAVLCQTTPTALFTLVGGASADRIGQRRILRTTLVIGTAASLVYVLLSLADVRRIWPVFVIAAVIGAAAAFQNPSRQSLINRLAPGPRLQNGVIYGTLAFMGGQGFIGPVLGGVTVEVIGQTAGFALESLLLLGAFFCMVHLRVPPAPVPPPPPDGTSLLGQIAAGLGYVRKTPQLWQVLTLGAAPGLFFIGVTQPTYPILARETFGYGPSGISLLNGAMAVGAILGSILLAKWGPRTARGRWFIRALPVGGLCMALVGIAPTLWMAMVVLVIWGLAAAVFINFASTLLQTYSESAYIGRVLSIYSLCVLGAAPLGNLHAGLGNQFADPRVVMVYSGLLALVVGVVSFATFRAARALD